MVIGNYEIKKKKPFIPMGYLLVCTMEKDENNKFNCENYVLNKITCLMDRKKIWDGSFLSEENFFTSFEEVQKFIKDKIGKTKSIGKFLGSGLIHNISYVEYTIVEKKDNYEISVNSMELIWNKKDKILVPIE